jgi:hypothetical protein
LAAATESAAFAADTVVWVSPTASDTWVKTGTTPIVAAADTDGNTFIPFGQIIAVGVNKGDVIEGTTAICVTPAE